MVIYTLGSRHQPLVIARSLKVFNYLATRDSSVVVVYIFYTFVSIQRLLLLVWIQTGSILQLTAVNIIYRSIGLCVLYCLFLSSTFLFGSETPVTAHTETPVTAHKETPVTTHKETPVTAHKEIPVTAHTETPVTV